MAADWSELLPELVIEIARNLPLVPDQISFANVCNSWQSAVSTLENFLVSPLRFPYLLLAEKTGEPSDSTAENRKEEEEDEKLHSDLREIFVLTPDGEGKIHKILLPEATKKKSVSSQGWLLTVSENYVNVALLHPLTRREIQLPKLDTFLDFESKDIGDQDIITKMVLSSNPSLTDDFYVMVTWGASERAGYCRPGFASWIETPREGFAWWIKNSKEGDGSAAVDINYHNGRMYVVHWNCEICSCVIGDNPRKLQRHPLVPVVGIEEDTNRHLYVLGGGGFDDDDDDDDDKLVVVVRVGRRDILDYNHKENRTSGFQVFEINLKDNKWEWVKVESLGDRALFLGYNSSISVKADGCMVKPNCIYFTEDFTERYYQNDEGGGKDMGIYHLTDGTIEPHFKGESLSRISPPLWVVPSFAP